MLSKLKPLNASTLYQSALKNEKLYKKRFKAVGENFIYAPKNFQKIIAVENASFTVACYVCELIKFLKKTDVAILIVNGEIDTDWIKDKIVIAIKLDSVEQDVLSSSTLSGFYRFELSTYPNKNKQLRQFLTDVDTDFSFEFADELIFAQKYFY